MSALPTPPQSYDQRDQASTRGEIERMDAKNHKKTGNIEVGGGKAVIFTDTATGKRYSLVITNGALALNGPL